ncbi:MAG: hypothetical protein ACLPRE_12315 [Limisphaerales bacterium]
MEFSDDDLRDIFRIGVFVLCQQRVEFFDVIRKVGLACFARRQLGIDFSNQIGEVGDGRVIGFPGKKILAAYQQRGNIQHGQIFILHN